MSEWIKYDGTNKPDDDALVRVMFPDGWTSEPDDWRPARRWDWLYDSKGDDDLILAFILKEDAK